MNAVAKVSKFVGDTFSIWVILFALLGFLMPTLFTGLKGQISLLLGIVMFGMGLTLSSADFREVFRRPLDVALGVSIASVSTLIAPLATPAMISLLAGQWMDISASSLILDILKVVIVPIVLGVIVKSLFRKQAEAATVALPFVSTLAIVLIVSIVVGLNRDKIVETGLLIFLVVILHNGLGYLLGYLFAKAIRMNPAQRKAIVFETGMQNSGLGASLAAAHFNPLAAVPSAIFSVWHNISGSLLATWFARRAAKEEQQTTDWIKK